MPTEVPAHDLMGGLIWQDLELPPEVMQPVAVAADSAAFAAPTPGVPPSQRWLQKGNLAADHVAAGAFDSAMRLLNRCVHWGQSQRPRPACCHVTVCAP